ncbi:MAG: valine--tRNA ligase [Actinobacteria bacterium]|nr:valine--tRNA ligase [Actinomycetota bacterium]NCW96414.1 valine--tRNA ligase [Actinomycetota bacterium]
MSELPSNFVPQDIEGSLYQKWLDAGYFSADAKSDKPPFCIVIPPPNVTGSLHIGHALDHTLQDLLIRMKRMKGFETLWLPGMDHAGIATQNVVEKQLAAQGKSRHDFGREEFVKKVWEWKAESGGAILGQMKRLGDSVDWKRERFTMDEGLSRAVLTIFKRLYDAGLIYRAERIINWCPRCLTALSDIEVDYQEIDGEFVQIRYGELDGDHIFIATTRPETMLGDGAVAVNPNDERYKEMIGKKVKLPYVNRMIPIIADELVDPEFGTGAVKVTAAHDPNDFEMGLRHNVPMIIIMNEAGVMDGTGTQFDGMDRFTARKAVVEQLRQDGMLGWEKRPYKHSVGHCSRCNTIVEPRLSMQWFVKVAPLAKMAGDAVRDGRVEISPKELEPRYFDWVDNMHDWCISRQLWWGHRIPVWYGPNGEMEVVGPEEQAPAGWVQDEDVLDTWFSSALWPFSTLGWPEETAELKKFYPTSVLVTGYDILFFWVARMMIFGLFAMDGRQPFDVIALHGLVRDKHGKKMSKSKGNVIDPLEFMDKYGSDALRFALARGANPGADQALADEWIAGARNFATKVWNATRFAAMNGATVTGELPDRKDLNHIDKWILDLLDRTIEEVDSLYEEFEFAKGSDALYHFAWDEVCDWYLELVKDTFAKGGVGADKSKRVLGHVLDQLLRLMHPSMPFISEALWTSLTGGESLVIASWPKASSAQTNQEALDVVEDMKRLITEIRRFRSEQGIKTSARIKAEIQGMSGALSQYEDSIRFLVRLDKPDSSFKQSAKIEVGSFTVTFDLSGAIDVKAERARLSKDLAAVEKDRETAKVKLENENFMAKAPMDVVSSIRERLEFCDSEIVRIKSLLDSLPKE